MQLEDLSRSCQILTHSDGTANYRGLEPQPIRALYYKGEQRKLRKQGPGNAQTEHEVSRRNCRRSHGSEQPFEEHCPPLMFCRFSCDPVPANGNETSHGK